MEVVCLSTEVALLDGGGSTIQRLLLLRWWMTKTTYITKSENNSHNDLNLGCLCKFLRANDSEIFTGALGST